ncbi:hypothetical protein [Brevundimonas lutea]|uniref:hypothetical protein n=1 Tax=Brevundimonas lutea TaxID=2293980 RepID=UPI000F017E7A|nr:hypothetical protein [Brevundimonas lutea]
MSRAVPPARATHYRLSAETWALIAEEYAGGASAKEVAAKWKVSAGSVYRRACLDGFTKAAVGDARAREHAARVEAGEAEAEAEAAAPAKTRRRRPAPYKRKGPETWDLIAELYLAGAPARVLAERYGVTADNIWRRARRHGWSRPRQARARERAKGQGVVLEDLLVPPLDPFDDAGDPAVLARQALSGVAEAMRQNRLGEARTLAALAASLSQAAKAREAAASGGGRGGRGTVTLDQLVDCITGDQAVLRALLAIDPDGRHSHPAKSRYWQWKEEQRKEHWNATVLVARDIREAILSWARWAVAREIETGVRVEPLPGDWYQMERAVLLRGGWIGPQGEQWRDEEVEKARRGEPVAPPPRDQHGRPLWTYLGPDGEPLSFDDDAA